MTTTRDAAIEHLISTEFDKLRRFFATKVPHADVLDLAQNTILAFVEGDLRSEAAARAYLWGIARLQVLKYYEKHRRSSEPFDSTVHTAMDVAPGLSSQIDNRTRLLQALHTLPVEEQMAFEYRYGLEMKNDEVAGALHVSLATAKRYVERAEVKLRAALGVEPEAAGVAYQRL